MVQTLQGMLRLHLYVLFNNCSVVKHDTIIDCKAVAKAVGPYTLQDMLQGC